MAYGLPDIVGSYVKGRELGEQKAEQRKRKPYIEQLNQLALQKEEQSIALGKKQLTLQDYAIQQQQEKQKRALYKDMGQAAQWADTPDKWEQALDVYEQQGVDVQGFRGRYDLREATAGLNNPDFAAQQKAAQNLEKLVKTLPEDKQDQGRALAAVSPKEVAKFAGEQLAAEGVDKKTMDLVATLPPEQQAITGALLEFDPKEGAKLVRDIAKAKENPDKVTGEMRKTAGYANRMETAEQRLGVIEQDGYKPGGLFDAVSVGTTWGNWLVSPEGQKYRNAQEDWVRAKLRQESGAVIGEEEMKAEIKTYFAQPGDSPEVIGQKMERRQIATTGMKQAGGRAYDELSGSKA